MAAITRAASGISHATVWRMAVARIPKGRRGRSEGYGRKRVNEFGELDIIYNTAGLDGALGPLEEITVEDGDCSLAVLLRGIFRGMKHAIPEIRKRDSGSIIIDRVNNGTERLSESP